MLLKQNPEGSHEVQSVSCPKEAALPLQAVLVVSCRGEGGSSGVPGFGSIKEKKDVCFGGVFRCGPLKQWQFPGNRVCS